LSFRLGRVRMVSPQEGWADGWFFPTVGEGSGPEGGILSIDDR
jgi:hypothetical protein